MCSATATTTTRVSGTVARPAVADASGEVHGVAAHESVRAALRLDLDGAVRDVHQLVVAVLEFAPRVVVAGELRGVQLVMTPYQGTHPGLGRLRLLRADDVDAARGVGGGEEFDGRGAQGVGHLLQGAAARAGPVVLHLAQEGNRQAAAFGHDGEGEGQRAATAPYGRAHPKGLFFVVAHRSGSLLGSSFRCCF